MNFGTILNAMTKHCVALVVEGRDDNSKTLAVEFTNYVKIKNILNTQFKVYHSLNTSFVTNEDDARLFVSETINTLTGYSFSDIKTYNAILETKFPNVKKIKSTELNSHIGNLIRFTTTTNNGNVSQYVESLRFVTEHIQTMHNEDTTLSEVNHAMANSALKFLKPRHVVRIAIKKFNSDFENLAESDRSIFNILRSADDVKIKSLFESQLSELDNLMDNENLMDNIGIELSDKINESLAILRNGNTQKNILNGYELLEELKELNK